MKKRINRVISWIIIVLISVATFTFWKAISDVVIQLTQKMNIINPLVQALFIIIPILVIIWLLNIFLKHKGANVGKAIKDILRL